MEKITTFNGTIANKKDCRYIKGEFYKKNEQCFFIEGVWYRINSGYIAFDYENQEWKLIKSSTMINGIVDYNTDSQEIILGYFTPNKYRNVEVYIENSNEGSKTYTAINEKVLKGEFHIDLRSLKYVPKSKRISTVPNSAFRFGSSNTYSSNLVYNVRAFSKEELSAITKYTDEAISEYTPNEKICANLHNYLDNLTYGIEFETCYGMIPYHKLVECGLIPLRDGSINGFEYATIPYASSTIGKGVSLACKNINKYTVISENESLHLHIGNIPKLNKELISIMYILCCVLEDEIFSMFPRYYRNTSKFKARGKDYNQPLMKNIVDPDHNITFNNLALYLSSGKPYEGFGSNHPSDPDGQHKWQIETRYHWCNFIPLLFGNNKTIEFRVHTPTKNPYKIANWILITSAIVKYAMYIHSLGKEYNISDIKKTKLSTVINHVYSFNYKLKTHLNNYIELRKQWRVTADEAGDYIGSLEISKDMEYNVDF